MDLKNRSVYEHCFAAVQVLATWPRWQPANTCLPLAKENTFMDPICTLFPEMVRHTATYLSTLPTFFEEFDVVCPLLSSVPHSTIPNCRLEVVTHGRGHNVVKLVSVRPLVEGEVPTLLHAPQDLLAMRTWTHAKRRRYQKSAAKKTAWDLDLEAMFGGYDSQFTPTLCVTIALSLNTAARVAQFIKPGGENLWAGSITCEQVCFLVLSSKYNVSLQCNKAVLFENHTLSARERNIFKTAARKFTVEFQPGHFWSSMAWMYARVMESARKNRVDMIRMCIQTLSTL